MATELTDDNNDDVVEFTETVEDADGDSITETLELDKIDSVSQTGSDRNPSWFSYSKSETTLNSGAKETTLDSDIDLTSLNQGSDYEFLFTADDGQEAAERRFVVTAKALSVNLTVQSSKIQSDVSNFPVYVDLSDFPQAFWDTVAPDAAGLRVEDSGGSEVPREIVWIDKSNQAGTLYFRAPSLSASSNTKFTIKSGTSKSSPSPSDQNGRNAVWSNGYHRVYHFGDDPTDGVALDSTGGSDATIVDDGGGAPSRVFSGPTGAHWDFPGNTYLTIPVDDGSLDTAEDPFTLQTINAVDSDPSVDDDVHMATETSTNGPNIIYYDDGGKVQAFLGYSTDFPFFSWTVGQIENISFVHRSDESVEVYRNGSSTATNSNFDFQNSAQELWSMHGSQAAEGRIYSWFISKGTRTASWSLARNNNERNTSEFYNINPADLSGNRLYASFSATTEDIRGTKLSTEWNIGTANQTPDYSHNLNINNIYGIFVKPDGTKFYYVDNNSQEIYEETATTVFDPSSGTNRQSFSVGFAPNDIFIRRDDGSQVWLASGSKTVEQFDLPQNWNIVDGNGNTPSNQTSFSFPNTSSTNGIVISDSGKKLYILDDTDNEVYQYNLSTAYDLSTKPSSPDKSLDLSGQTNSNWAAEMRPNGEKLYTNDYDAENTIQWNLSTPYDVSTASLEKQYSWASTDDGLSGLVFV